MKYIFQEMDNIKEEFNASFDDDDSEKTKNTVPLEKYEELKVSVKNNAAPTPS